MCCRWAAEANLQLIQLLNLQGGSDVETLKVFEVGEYNYSADQR